MSDPKKPDQPTAAIKPGGNSHQPRSRAQDPEMRAASIITRLLGELDQTAARRIVGYLADRYLPANKQPVTEAKP